VLVTVTNKSHATMARTCSSGTSTSAGRPVGDPQAVSVDTAGQYAVRFVFRASPIAHWRSAPTPQWILQRHPSDQPS
jgi:hypothetical protein